MIKPQIQDFLMGTAIFAVSFIVAFYVFGGGDKIVRVFEAQKVAQANENFEQKLVEEEKQRQEEELAKQEMEEQQEEDLEGEEEGQVVVGEDEEIAVEEGIEEIKEVEVVELEVPTAQELAEKFQDVLDLGVNEEWKSYPLELRKEAFAIMNPPAEEVVEVEEAPVEVGEVVDPVSEMSQLDQVFMGVEQVPVEESQEQVSSEGIGSNEYVVQEGDSWWSLSDDFQTTPASLQELNSHISDLAPGVLIYVPNQ